MLHKLRNRAQDEKGFTLIELLVVILIIGILAAIALPAFLNQRAKAQDSEAKSNVRTAQTAMETYYTDNQTYVGADAAALIAIEPALHERQGPRGLRRVARPATRSPSRPRATTRPSTRSPTPPAWSRVPATTPARAGAAHPASGRQHAFHLIRREAGLRARFVVNDPQGATPLLPI